MGDPKKIKRIASNVVLSQCRNLLTKPEQDEAAEIIIAVAHSGVKTIAAYLAFRLNDSQQFVIIPFTKNWLAVGLLNDGGEVVLHELQKRSSRYLSDKLTAYGLM